MKLDRSMKKHNQNVIDQFNELCIENKLDIWF